MAEGNFPFEEAYCLRILCYPRNHLLQLLMSFCAVVFCSSVPNVITGSGGYLLHALCHVLVEEWFIWMINLVLWHSNYLHALAVMMWMYAFSLPMKRLIGVVLQSAYSLNRSNDGIIGHTLGTLTCLRSNLLHGALHFFFSSSVHMYRELSTNSGPYSFHGAATRSNGLMCGLGWYGMYVSIAWKCGYWSSALCRRNCWHTPAICHAVLSHAHIVHIFHIRSVKIREHMLKTEYER